MNKIIYTTVCILLVLMLLQACGGKDENGDDSRTFRATVIENEEGLLVSPYADTMEYRSSDKIAVNAGNAEILDADGKAASITDIKTGDTLELTYNGVILESYPAQISADKIMILRYGNP